MKNRFITAVLLSSFLLSAAGCGGRTPSPVMISQYGDQNKTCRALSFEMASIQGEIQRLLPDTDKTGKNVALGVTGFFLLVPLFFMDFKDAERVEYEAYRQRYNHIAMIATDKRCGLKKESYPSIQQMEKDHKEQQKKDQKKSSLNK